MRFATVLAVILLSIGCGPRGPILGTADRPPGVGGTISGSVTAEDGTTALSARKITAVNTETGARFDTSTATNGGYTIKVPKGKYRMELELRAGETIAKQPGQVEITIGDLDASENFIVARR